MIRLLTIPNIVFPERTRSKE